jgi:hypothetical protein
MPKAGSELRQNGTAAESTEWQNSIASYGLMIKARLVVRIEACAFPAQVGSRGENS